MKVPVYRPYSYWALTTFWVIFPDNVVARTSLNVLTPLVKRIRNLEADSGAV